MIFTYFIQHNGGFSTGNIDQAIVSEASDFAYRVASGEMPAYNHTDLPLKLEYGDFFNSLDNLLTLESPVGTKLSSTQEDLLNRYCVVLALMEEVFRSGGKLIGPLVSGQSNDIRSLIDIPDFHWVDDMRNLSWKFYDAYSHLLALPSTLNPTFEGSSDIGGADADLIVNGTLIDIKTTVGREIKPDWIRQLLGYVLLDYSNIHQIRAISLYMARQGILFEWELEDAIRRLSGSGASDIKSLREKFKSLV